MDRGSQGWSWCMEIEAGKPGDHPVHSLCPLGPTRAHLGPLGPTWPTRALLAPLGPLGPTWPTWAHLAHLGPLGPTWDQVEIDENLRKLMKIHGNPQKSIKINENRRKSMKSMSDPIFQKPEHTLFRFCSKEIAEMKGLVSVRDIRL